MATAFISDNTSDGKEPIEEQLLLDGEVVYADGGSQGGTSDYNTLNNLPKVNGVTVKGNVSLEELGVDNYVALKTESYVEEHKEELRGEQDFRGKEDFQGNRVFRGKEDFQESRAYQGRTETTWFILGRAFPIVIPPSKSCRQMCSVCL